MELKTVGVVGCGIMGSGIAQTCAQSGFFVVVRELNDLLLNKGLGTIEKNLAKMVKKGKIDEADKSTILARIKGTTHLDDFSDCDIVIEAVTEKLKLKQDIWTTLDKLCPSRTIFASNTSSLPILKQAEVTNRQEKFIGLHFFNPVPVMGLVEVIRPETCSEETYNTAIEFVKALGKTPVTCRDVTGFIVNRLLIPYLLDAIRALEAGIATAEDIDTALKLGCNHPMGPLTLADFVGLDTVAYIADILYQEFGQPQYRCPELLRQMVEKGKLGRKSGEGFYRYD